MKLLNKYTVTVKIEYINRDKEELQTEVFTVLNEDVIDYLERRWVYYKVFNSLSIICYIGKEPITVKRYKGLNDLTKQPLLRYFTTDFFYDLVRYFNGKSDIRFKLVKKLPYQKRLFD